MIQKLPSKSTAMFDRAYSPWSKEHAVVSKFAREVDVKDTLDKKWHEQFWRNACLCRAAPADLIAYIGCLARSESSGGDVSDSPC